MYQQRRLHPGFIPLRHVHGRELRFLALVLTTCCLIGLQLAEGVRLAGLVGAGWRALDLPVLQRRIDAGDLSDHEAGWYHQATEQEARAAGSREPTVRPAP